MIQLHLQVPLSHPQVPTAHETRCLDPLTYVGADAPALLGPPLIHMPAAMRMAATSASLRHVGPSLPEPVSSLGPGMQLLPLLPLSSPSVRPLSGPPSPAAMNQSPGHESRDSPGSGKTDQSQLKKSQLLSTGACEYDHFSPSPLSLPSCCREPTLWAASALDPT